MLATLGLDQLADFADLAVQPPFHSRKVMGRA